MTAAMDNEKNTCDTSNGAVTEQRPWGSFTVIGGGDGFKVKIIEIAPGGELSLQYHRHRKEFWTVTKGSGTVTVGTREIAASAPAHFEIECGEVHRAKSEEGMTFVEVQYGDVLSEDDIVRLEDKYNRESGE